MLYRLYNLRSGLLLGLCLWVFQVNGQNSSPSAYTSFGIGRIEEIGSARYKAMGGAGIALPSAYGINSLNPASLANIHAEQMYIDLGIKGNYTSYSHNTQSGTGLSGGLNNLWLAFKSTKNLKTAVGLRQYSSVGYNVVSSAYIQGTSTAIAKNYEGSGGINQLAISNALKLGNNFSLGARVSYLFGKLKKTELFTSSEIGGELSIQYADFLQQLYLETGFQYAIPFEKSKITIGGIYNLETVFKSDREVLTSSTSGAGITEELDGDDYSLPALYGGGISWTNQSGIKVAFDYKNQDWSGLYDGSNLVQLKNSHYFNGGVEYFRKKSRRANPYLWRMGGFYQDSYIKVKGNTIVDRGITAGVGIPLRTQKSYLNVSFKYGHRGTRSGSLITENYYEIGVSMSMVESWFRKMQFD